MSPFRYQTDLPLDLRSREDDDEDGDYFSQKGCPSYLLGTPPPSSTRLETDPEELGTSTPGRVSKD